MQNKSQVTYWDYLKIDDLLKLQNGLNENSDDISEDELNFIIIHQVDELWFKMIIRELYKIIKIIGQEVVEEDKIMEAVNSIKRVSQIIKLAGDHFKLMETMTPQNFMKFRAKLGTASGFQSAQLRIIEFSMGLKKEQMVNLGDASPVEHLKNAAGKVKGGKETWDKIERAIKGENLREALHKWLYRTPIDGSTPDKEGDREIVTDFINKYLEKHYSQQDETAYGMAKMMEMPIEQIKKRFEEGKKQAFNFLMANDIEDEELREREKRIRTAILFIESYSNLPLLSWPRALLNEIAELEQTFVVFRFVHARMVERIIGRRIGTGGSSGVDYLDATTKYRVFQNLWAVRTILNDPRNLPELQNLQHYNFARELE